MDTFVFNSRFFGILIATFVSIIVFLSQWLTGGLQTFELYYTFPVLWLSTFLLVYVSLEFLIFKEINKIYSVLEKLKNKDKSVKLKDFKTKNLPIKRKKIFEEVYSYVSKKQAEINELKKLENFRREFLADISHELKTPIFAAQGFIHTLLDGAIYDKQNRIKFLEKAAKSLDGLQMLVDDLLILSQIETGEMKMQITAFDIVSLTQDIFDLLENQAKHKGIELKLADSNYKSLFIMGDDYRIYQVMKNLVENAIKYGYEGGKVIVGFDEDKENVIISIKDNGPGIAPEHLKRVFDRFYRIEKSRGKEKGGSGLGLAIVKQIIEAHHSKVMVTSKIGKGTTFAFILKAAPKYVDTM